MQDSPDRKVILEAVARFLAKDVVAAIDDKGVAFRVRVAAHLVGQVCRELHAEEIADPQELAGLAAVFGETSDAVTPAERHDAIRAYEARLAAALRDGSLPAIDPIRQGLMKLLEGRLQVANPRFDPHAEVQ